EALRLSPNAAQAYYLRGVAHWKLSAPSQAVADLTEAIRLDPEHARAYAQRAAIRRATRRHELALEDLAHAVRLDTQSAGGYVSRRAVTRARGGQFAWAVADYPIALLLDPENAAARSARERAWKAYLTRPRPPAAAAASAAAASVAAASVAAASAGVALTAP